MNIQWMKHLFNQQAGGFMTQPSQQQEVSQEDGGEGERGDYDDDDGDLGEAIA